jgi:uncharacterized membrane protein
VEDDEASNESVFEQERYARSGTGLEFDRVANFADAIYAISLTLIVVGIAVPRPADEASGRQLLDALNEQLPNIITFFVVFFVVGNYWFAHHRFMGWLGSVDARLIHIQLVYLSVIAFLPFPAALLGTLDDNPYALAIFALSMAAASLVETIMIGHAHRAGLMKQKLSDDAYRWERFASLTPVAVFLVSIPIAFVSVWLGIAFWFANAPVGLALNRRRPAEFGGPVDHSRR